MKNRKKILAGGVFVGIMMFMFFPVYEIQAQGYAPLTNVPGIFEQGKATNPVQLMTGFYGFAIGIGAVLAVVMIIYAGFTYMYQESITGKSDARDRITNAFLGLLVILGSYIILRTINADLVNFDLTLPGGQGRLARLVAITKEMEEEGRKSRENLSRAQASAANIDNQIDAVDKEIEILKNQLKINPDKKDAIETEITNKENQKKILNAEKSYSLTKAIVDRSFYINLEKIDSMKNFDDIENGLERNKEATLEKLRKTREDLIKTQPIIEAACIAKPEDCKKDELRKQVLEIDVKEKIYNAQMEQLKWFSFTKKSFDERTEIPELTEGDVLWTTSGDTKKRIGEKIKEIGKTEIEWLRKNGYSVEASTLEKNTNDLAERASRG